MRFNFKKQTLAIWIAFALGLMLSKNIKAQEDQQIEQIEATIAQLQLQLQQIKASRGLPLETTVPQIESLPDSRQGLVAPGIDARNVQTLPEPLPEMVFPTEFEVPPQIISPAASFAPSINPQLPLTITPAIPPTVIRSSPPSWDPAFYEYCPTTGRVVPRVNRQYYYRPPVGPPLNGVEWDYWDEHYYGR